MIAVERAEGDFLLVGRFSILRMADYPRRKFPAACLNVSLIWFLVTILRKQKKHRKKILLLVGIHVLVNFVTCQMRSSRVNLSGCIGQMMGHCQAYRVQKNINLGTTK